MAKINMLSDEELLCLLQGGNRAAYTEIYNRYWKFLFTTAYNVHRNREDSMDACQTVFLWFWENCEHIRITTTLAAYLHTAVKYKLANMIRNGKYRENLFDDLQSVDLRTYQQNELEIKELKNLIDHLIDGLPAKCREVFLMSRNENLSHREIADRLGISEKTVNDHVTRALQKLKAPLRKLASIFLLF